MAARIVQVLLLFVWTVHSLRSRYNGAYRSTNSFSNRFHPLFASVKKRPGYMLPDLSQSKFPDIPEEGYDLIVIGSGPAGEAAAVRAAKHGARVAIVEKKSTFGGPTGLTSKAVREAAKRICKAVDQIGGDRRRQVKGLWRRSFPVLKTEAEVLQAKETRDRLAANGVDLFVGAAALLGDGDATFSDFWGDDDALICRVCRSAECVEVKTKNVVIASGSRPNRPTELRPGVPLPFTKGRVVCATEMGNLINVPGAAAVIGGGVIAVEYATVLAELGVGVSLICPDDQFLPFLEEELRQAIKRRMKKNHILFVREPVKEIAVAEDSISVALERASQVQRLDANGEPLPRRNPPERKLKVELVLYSGGRDANSEDLGLSAVGADIGKYGRVTVDANYRTTSKKSVYAVGDVIGPPGLASAAQQQARAVADGLFAERDPRDDGKVSELWSQLDAPLTLWTIPEVSSVGATAKQAREVEEEEQLADAVQFDEDRDEEGGEKSNSSGSSSTSSTIEAIRVAKRVRAASAASGGGNDREKQQVSSIVEGYGYFKDMARGRLSGDLDGFLKVVARYDGPEKHTIIGVHIMGEGANELIQLGSILTHSKTTLETVSRTPFAAVTLSGLYQMACDDALTKSPFTVSPARRKAAAAAAQRAGGL